MNTLQDVFYYFFLGLPLGVFEPILSKKWNNYLTTRSILDHMMLLDRASQDLELYLRFLKLIEPIYTFFPEQGTHWGALGPWN